MSSMLQITVLSGASAATVKGRLRFDSLSGFVPSCMERVASLISAMAGGVHTGRLTVATTAVQATGTVTFSSIANNDTVTINGRVYTAKTSGATGLQQFNIGGSDTQAALNLQTIVNADTSALIVGCVKASSASAGVTTITALVPGNIGNLGTLAISAHGSVSAANLASGSQDAPVTFYNGI